MKKLLPVLAVLIVLYLAFMTALVGRAELDGGDDLNHIAVSSWLSWKQIGTAFFVPKSSENALGTGLAAHVLSNRVGQTLVIKALHDFFGSRPLPYYLFQMTLGALCMALLAWAVYGLTESLGVAVFAAFFFALLPSAFLHNIFLSDFAEAIHLCTLVSFACLYYFFLPLRRGGVPPSGNRPSFVRWGMVAAVGILSALCAVRTKPSGWIIPLMAAAALLLPLVRRRWKETLALCGLGALIFVLSFPPVSFHFENIPRMLFYNGMNEFESETSVALWNLNSVLPVSLARNANFFFLWLAVFSGVVLIRNGRCRFREEVLFVLVWFFLEVGFYTLTDNAPRYLTDALIPLIILLCVLFKNAWTALRPGFERIVFGVLFVSGLLFHGVNNFQHLIFLRDWKAGYFNELNKSVQVIYNDLKGRPPGFRNPAEEIMPFAWPVLTEEVRRKIAPKYLGEKKAGPALPDVLVFSDVGDLYPCAYDAEKTQRILGEGHPVYGISYQGNPPDKSFVELTSFRKVPPSPITEFLAKFKKKKRSEKIWIFKKLPQVL